LYDADGNGHKPEFEVRVQENGFFEFPEVTDGKYYAYVKLDNHANQSYPGVKHTYYQETFKWKEAKSIYLSCGDSTSLVIDMVENPSSTNGNGLISGRVIKDIGGLKSDYPPIEDADVILVDQISNLPIATAITDSEGYYEMSGIGSGYYTMYIDIVGISQESTYSITIDPGNTEFLNMDFEVDLDIDFVINTIDLSTTSIENRVGSLDIKAYPNPASDLITIYSDNWANSTIEISLISNTGAIAKTKQVAPMEIDNGEIRIDLSNISAGNYLLKIISGTDVGLQNIIVEE
jgi:hypothetical protein